LYLKQLELIGFKSFAQRTRLEFGSGMTAIVGPNGCGKSNISDAVRWALGEQSAKAMRGSSMQDVIFNGTDAAKPTNMAEVSLTLSDCEESLGTDFHEVTITRRVLRSGEGQYYINRAPCRLKDIQRLFMDTGIGTNAYSVLEQGRIDRILSSRPDDRREVFEEASGITKYKADKKEALRKLQHTEANLLRLEDIIREVKRQIISLQRQAGKARRYKTMHAKLRSLDIFVTQDRLKEMDGEISRIEKQLASIDDQDTALNEVIEKAESQVSETRLALVEIEHLMNATMDQSVEAKTKLDRVRQELTTNRERITELRDLSQRNTSEAETARLRLNQHQTTLDDLSGKLAHAITTLETVREEHRQKQTVFTTFETDLRVRKEEVHNLHNESVDLETRLSKLQNELADIEARERGTIIKRERLMAERTEMKRAVELYAERVNRKAAQQHNLNEEVVHQEELLEQLNQQKKDRTHQIDELRDTLQQLQNERTAKRTQIEMLERSEADDSPYPAGARFLSEPPDDLNMDREWIHGPLADHIEAEPDYRKALEAVMRAWLDALLVKDRESCIQLLAILANESVGAARLLCSDLPPPPDPVDASAERLIDHVICDDKAKIIMQHLLLNVRVIDDLKNIPDAVSREITWVTRAGAILRGDGSAEYWMPESGTTNPLTRKHLIAEWTQEAEKIDKYFEQHKETLEKLKTDDSNSQEALAEEQTALSIKKRDLAVCDGETQQIQREAKQAEERRETIEWELNELKEQDSSGGNRSAEIVSQIETFKTRQAEIRVAIQTQNDTLRKLDADRTRLHAELTDCRISVSEKQHVADQYRNQEEPLRGQIRSLEQIIEERSRGISSYQKHIDDLENRIQEADQSIEPMEKEVQRFEELVTQERQQQRDANQKQAELEENLRSQRMQQEELRKQKGLLDVEISEQRIRRQNVLERVRLDYQLREEQLNDEAPPEWEENETHDRETLEITIAELRTKINSMGPVNLVAIEEHQELEERFQFLTQQLDDLVKAKQQLLDMIKKINETTTELFSDTFNKVNAHFQVKFKELFGGGSAKLVLVNEEDVLESGIEIIARPPGKKLQSISLLSGGERTMTAVALLFSLYMVKPSPFCVLDELDAALDDTNIGRFVKLLQGFLEDSQFIVITHSRQTITAADVLYGITMEKAGISNMVTLKLTDYEESEDQTEKESFAGK